MDEEEFGLNNLEEDDLKRHLGEDDDGVLDGDLSGDDEDDEVDDGDDEPDDDWDEDDE